MHNSALMAHALRGTGGGSAGPAPGPIATDDFDRPNSSGIGGDWTESPSAPNIILSNNQLVIGTVNTGRAIFNVEMNPGAAGAYIQFDMDLIHTNGATYIMFFIEEDPDGAKYSLGHQKAATFGWRILDQTDGSTVELSTYDSVNASSGTTWRGEVVQSGSDLVFTTYVDDVEVDTATKASTAMPSSLWGGLQMSRYGSGNAIRVNNWEIGYL